jgi:hypothetical protein
MSTSTVLWLNRNERPDKPVVIFEQENVRVTVDGNEAYFEARDTDRVGVERWHDAESDWVLRKILTILAKQQIELAKRRDSRV